MSDTRSENKKLSKVVPKEFYTQLDLGIHHHNEFHKCIMNAIQIGKHAELGDYEIALLIREYCKGKISKSSLWRYTKEIEDKQLTEIEESSSRFGSGETDRIEESSSYEESDEEKQILEVDNLPTTIIETPRQQTIDEFLNGYADGERSFYFQDVSMTFVRTQLLTRKGVNKFRRVFFEVE